MLMLLAVVAAALVIGVGTAWILQEDEPEASWQPIAEGFLAVATPCCTEASLWDSLEAVTSDGQRARPATAAEAVLWLDDWPYRQRLDDRPTPTTLQMAAQSSEVRCIGPPTGAAIPRRGNEVETAEALKRRRECTYAKWKIWSDATAGEHPNERHTIWVDEDGFYHGRVDYWR
jgi:hypothetical protein